MAGYSLSQWACLCASGGPAPRTSDTHFPHFGVAHGDDFDAEGLGWLLPLRRHVGLHRPRSAEAAGSGVPMHPASPSLRPPCPMAEPLRSSPPWLRGSPSPPLPGRGRSRAVGKRRAAEGERSLAMTARRDVIAGLWRTGSRGSWWARATWATAGDQGFFAWPRVGLHLVAKRRVNVTGSF